MPPKSPAASRPLKQVSFVSLVNIPGFAVACNRIVRGGSATFQGSNQGFAEQLEMVGDIIIVNGFHMPVHGGGILGWLYED
jgi:hypothetical protein